MVCAYNKLTREWTSTETPELLVSAEAWIIDPIFDDFNRANELGPSFWTFPGGSTIHVLTDEEIDVYPSFVAEAKTAKIIELSESCAAVITGGVTSSALGTPRIYDSQIEDQLNLIGAEATTSGGGTIYYSSRDPITLEKTYLEHTNAQLRQVLIDGANLKLSQLIKFNTKKAYVLAQTSIAVIAAVTWD